MLSRLLHQTNLVNLIGYCADGDQRLLVTFMSLCHWGHQKIICMVCVLVHIIFHFSRPCAFFSLFSASPYVFFCHGSIKNDLSSLAYRNYPSGEHFRTDGDWRSISIYTVLLPNAAILVVINLMLFSYIWPQILRVTCQFFYLRIIFFFIMQFYPFIS